MRFKKHLMICMFFMLLAGCRQIPQEELLELSEEPVDFEVDELGAFMNTADFQMVIEPDSLGGKGYISLSRLESEKTKNMASPRYCLEGPILHFQTPVSIRIKPDKRLKEDTYLMIYEEVFVPQQNQVQKSYYLVQGEVGETFVEGRLPVQQVSKPVDESLNPFTVYTDPQQIRIEVALLTNQKTEALENIRLVSDQSEYLGFSEIFLQHYVLLQKYFEKQLVMEEQKNEQDILVEFRETPDVDCQETVLYVPNIWGETYRHYIVYIKDGKLPTSFQAQLAKAMFVHYQQQYDYRNAYAKAVSPPAYYWFNIACRSWVEGEFGANELKVPSDFYGYEEEMLKGLFPRTPQLDAHQKHGLGMVSLIQFIQINYDEKSIGAIYQSLQNGSDLESALEFAMGDLNEWLISYYKAFIMGTLYETGDDQEAIWTQIGLLNPLKIPAMEKINEDSKEHLLLNHFYIEPLRPYFMALVSEKQPMDDSEKDEKWEIYSESSEIVMRILEIDEATGKMEKMNFPRDGIFRLRHIDQWQGKKVLMMLVYIPENKEVLGKEIRIYGNLGRWPQDKALFGEWKDGIATVQTIYMDPIFSNAVRTGDQTVETYGCDPDSLDLIESMVGEKRILIMEFSEEETLQMRMNLYHQDGEVGTLSEPIALTYEEGVLSGDHEFEYNTYKIQMELQADVIQIDQRLKMDGTITYTFVDEAVASSVLKFHIEKVETTE